MRPLFALRLFLDLLTASLLLAAMAYYWFGNLTHEVLGTGMFALVVAHNVLNRRWYKMVTRNWSAPRVAFSRSITLCLLVAMAILLVTSVVISRSVFSFLPLTSTFTVRQIHALVGYVVLFAASLHLGLQWSTIMRAIGSMTGFTVRHPIWSWTLRGLAVVVALYGAYSLTVIGVWSKLSMQPSFDFWDFETAAMSFVVHHAAIIGLGAFLAHYTTKLLPASSSAR